MSQSPSDRSTGGAPSMSTFSSLGRYTPIGMPLLQPRQHPHQQQQQQQLQQHQQQQQLHHQQQQQQQQQLQHPHQRPLLPMTGIPHQQPHSQMLPFTPDQRVHSQQLPSRATPTTPPYGLTPQGDKFPVAFGPYLQHGLPVRVSKACEDPNIQFLVFKFPEGFDIRDLAKPIQIQRDASLLEIAEDTSSSMLDTRPINFRRHDKRKRIDATRCPWKVTDQNKKNLIGRKTGLDTSTYFVMVERVDGIDMIPLDSWFSFSTELRNDDGANEVPSTDLAERKRRAALKMEERASARLAYRVTRDESSDDGSGDGKNRMVKRMRREKVGAGQEQEDASLYDEDGGLKRQQQKRLKSMLQRKKRKTKNDYEDVGDSALNLGELKRHAVDWDWDEDGKATDDEGEGDDEKPNDAMDDSRNDFADSDDEEREVLTKFGQKVTSALESQKEQDADDELAQFSEGEDEDDESRVESQISGESVTSKRGKDDDNSTSSSPTSTTKVSSGLKPTVLTTKGTTHSQMKEESLTASSVRQKVVRLLLLHGGTMPTKQFINTFNITSNKSELFQLVRKSINEVCEVHTETINNEEVKVLELRAQFRQA